MSEDFDTSSFTEENFPRPTFVRPRFCHCCKKYTNKIILCKTPKNGGKYLYSCPECYDKQKSNLLGTKRDGSQKQAPFLGFYGAPSPATYANKNITEEAAWFKSHPSWPKQWADGIDCAESVEDIIYKCDVIEAIDKGLPPPAKKPAVASLPTTTSVRSNLLLPTSATATASSVPSVASSPTTKFAERPPPLSLSASVAIDTKLNEILSAVQRLEEKIEKFNDAEQIAEAVFKSFNNNNNNENGPVSVDLLGLQTTNVQQPGGNSSRKRRNPTTTSNKSHQLDSTQDASQNDTVNSKKQQRTLEHLRPSQPVGVSVDAKAESEEDATAWLNQQESYFISNAA
jgi:hypothetical protein